MFDIGNFIAFTVILSIGLPVLITVIVLGTLVWTFRRVFPTGKAAAEQQLRARLASGEISPSEYEARLDALRSQR